MHFPTGCMMSYFTVNQYSWRQLQIPTSTSRPVSQSALWQLCLIQVLPIYQAQIHPQNTLSANVSKAVTWHLDIYKTTSMCNDSMSHVKWYHLLWSVSYIMTVRVCQLSCICSKKNNPRHKKAVYGGWIFSPRGKLYIIWKINQLFIYHPSPLK